MRELLSGAFAIAMLGAIESLLSAVVADGMAGTRHDPDAELLALGIGNVVTPFFGGIPATGAIARTATNIRSGARSPVAAMVHALTVLVGRARAGAADRLPAHGGPGRAAAAGRLEHVRGEALRAHPAGRAAQRRAGAAHLLRADRGLRHGGGRVGRRGAGRAAVHAPDGRDHPGAPDGRSGRGASTARAPPRIPGGAATEVAIYDIAGPLFFGAAQKAMGSLGAIAGRLKVLIIRLDTVPVMDATGLVALESAIAALTKTGVRHHPHRPAAAADGWSSARSYCRDPGSSRSSPIFHRRSPPRALRYRTPGMQLTSQRAARLNHRPGRPNLPTGETRNRA